MRDVEYLEAVNMKTLANIRRGYLKIIGVILGVSVPPGTFGRGLSIPHYGSIVVNDKVRGGRYCRIHSSTNIGQADGGAPIFGEGVYIGPGAVISGPIRVGNGVVVGANSFVNKSVSDNSVVGGVPAKIIGSSLERSPMPPWILEAVRSDV